MQRTYGEVRTNPYAAFSRGILHMDISVAQSAWAVEYTDYISTEGYDPPPKITGYDIKLSDGEASVMLEIWGIRSTPLLPYRSVVHPGPVWLHAIGSHLWVK